MATDLRLVYPAPGAKTYQINHKSTSLFSSSNHNITPSRKSHHRIQSSKFGSFLDLIKPVSEPNVLDFDHLSWFDPADRSRVDRKELKTKLLEKSVSSGIRFRKAKGSKVEHEEFESSIVCDDETELKASLVVDASGHASPIVKYEKSRNHGYQIGHGILAEEDGHPFDLDKIVLVDWRDPHLGNEPNLRASNSRIPTFPYVRPFYSNLVFLEEICLVSRLALSDMEIKSRMVARLRHLGIRAKNVVEDEKASIHPSKCDGFWGRPLYHRDVEWLVAIREDVCKGILFFWGGNFFEA
ncbi:unnamed protein product [Dovyalis caffra]|uniref:Uncharacterized protein n=1 Tax=Dovyalis caffra TaxID=77055 RepID=A0AAV1RCV1_9ROSI|nr:unnamed protein product [Dovyalis caffra]